MVLRYWGANDVHPEDWAQLVQGDGIPAAALQDAAEKRGFEAHVASLPWEDAAHHLRQGRPLIALIELAAGQRHYVVLVGATETHLVLHDPALGPWRVVPRYRFLAQWQATERLTLLVLPRDRRDGEAPSEKRAPGTDDDEVRGTDQIQPSPPTAEGSPKTPCTAEVESAVAAARAGDLAGAAARLGASRALCPGDPRPVRELASLRFRERRYQEATRLAREASALEPSDFTSRLLATSLFLRGDTEGALDSWNEVNEPRLDQVHVTGLSRTRILAVHEQLGLSPREVILARDFARTERRARALPFVSLARVALEPAKGGIADLRIALVERPLLGHPAHIVARLATDALLDRSARLTATSPFGAGERIELGGRFVDGREAVSVEIIEPGGLGLPGLVGATLSWERQTFGLADPLRETRLGGRVFLENWWSSSLHARLSLGAETWNESKTAFPLGVDIDHRLLDDRLALRASGTSWVGPTSPDFATAGLLLAARTSRKPKHVEASLTAGFTAATSGAPRSIWPGAGLGLARPYLSRAHPLLRDGSIAGDAFGRGLAHLSFEGGPRGRSLGPLTLGAAGFVDLVRPWRPVTNERSGLWLTSVGVGLRLHLPGSSGTLRADVAWAGDGGKPVFSTAWQTSWPRVPASIR